MSACDASVSVSVGKTVDLVCDVDVATCETLVMVRDDALTIFASESSA